jgi:hypothetical protein
MENLQIIKKTVAAFVVNKCNVNLLMLSILIQYIDIIKCLLNMGMHASCGNGTLAVTGTQPDLYHRLR